jgi:hypothetical protein
MKEYKGLVGNGKRKIKNENSDLTAMVMASAVYSSLYSFGL